MHIMQFMLATLLTVVHLSWIASNFGTNSLGSLHYNGLFAG